MRPTVSARLRTIPWVVLSVALLGACASGKGAAVNEPTQSVQVLPPDAAPAPPADGMPMGFSAAFAAADARARAALFFQQCAATVLRLRAAGTFGKAASAPKLVYCERTADGLPVGGVYDIDSAFTQVRRLTLVRLDGARPKFVDPIDTVRVAREGKLMRDIGRDIVPVLRRQGRLVNAVPVTVADAPTEGLLLPAAGTARTVILGGDLVITRAADGSLVRATDRSAARRVVTFPAAGVIQLASASRDVPTTADLVAARSLAERGRDVVVSTNASRSTLTRGFDPATGSRFSWQHTRVTP